MKKTSNAVKVGIFAAFCVIGLLYLSIGTGKFHIRSPGYRLFVLFDDVAGLNVNGPVMLNGMEVGRVLDMKVDYAEENAKVRLTLLIRPEIKIGADPIVSIRTLGFMGEKYVHIYTRQKGDAFLKPGTELEGKKPAEIDSMMTEVETLTKNINGLVEELKGVASRLNTEGLSKSVSNLGDISEQVSLTLKNNRESLDRIIMNLEVTSRNFEDFSTDIKKHPWKLLFKGKSK